MKKLMMMGLALMATSCVMATVIAENDFSTGALEDFYGSSGVTVAADEAAMTLSSGWTFLGYNGDLTSTNVYTLTVEAKGTYLKFGSTGAGWAQMNLDNETVFETFDGIYNTSTSDISVDDKNGVAHTVAASSIAIFNDGEYVTTGTAVAGTATKLWVGTKADVLLTLDSIKLTSGAVVSIPEPATLGLIAFAGLGLLVLRRRMA